MSAHRVAWTLTNGTIPDGMSVLHRCDNPPCVRPDHLFLGSMADNTHDMVTKGRSGPRNRPERMAHGSDHHAAKLTERDVTTIREAHANGTTLTALGGQYGVTTTTIFYIVHRQTWKHVP